MATHPEVQRKAQAELDAVVGPKRLPTFADRSSLPYVNALVTECLRWKPTAQLGLPHCPIEDDVYNGYTIPGGSLLMPNVWYVLDTITLSVQQRHLRFHLGQCLEIPGTILTLTGSCQSVSWIMGVPTRMSYTRTSMHLDLVEGENVIS